MQQGVNDVLPSSAFDNLTAEDLHLLMNGSPVVDVEVLKWITSFSTDLVRQREMGPLVSTDMLVGTVRPYSGKWGCYGVCLVVA